MRKRDAERKLRTAAKRVTTGGVLWIDARWIETLGRERLTEVCAQEGFDPPKSYLGRLA